MPSMLWLRLSLLVSLISVLMLSGRPSGPSMQYDSVTLGQCDARHRIPSVSSSASMRNACKADQPRMQCGRLKLRIESAKNCAASTGMLRSLHERNVVVECAWRCGNRIAYVVRPSELLAEHESKAPTRRIGCHCLESDTHGATP